MAEITTLVIKSKVVQLEKLIEINKANVARAVQEKICVQALEKAHDDSFDDKDSLTLRREGSPGLCLMG